MILNKKWMFIDEHYHYVLKLADVGLRNVLKSIYFSGKNFFYDLFFSMLGWTGARWSWREYESTLLSSSGQTELEACAVW